MDTGNRYEAFQVKDKRKVVNLDSDEIFKMQTDNVTDTENTEGNSPVVDKSGEIKQVLTIRDCAIIASMLIISPLIFKYIITPIIRKVSTKIGLGAWAARKLYNIRPKKIFGIKIPYTIYKNSKIASIWNDVLKPNIASFSGVTLIGNIDWGKYTRWVYTLSNWFVLPSIFKYFSR
jgi:hypothetical protein|uniref:ORFD n=1 Tax=Bremia lactucae associated ORFan virus 1 TaxID=3070700 RepID=A0AA50F4L1_9VIRU|nr:ORFD [Bremia lactucae associated ORFan virus 1]